MEQLTSITWPQVRWLDDDTVLMLDRIAALDEPLLHEEQLHADEMTRPRRREFAAGRTLARRALSVLLAGPVSSAIPVGTAGEPVWPKGLTGSLSHTSTHAAALVARCTRHASVGVDLDDRRLIGATAAADLMTVEEVKAVLAQEWACEIALAQNVVFSAKEALFKYQYPLTGNRELDFDEVCLHLSPGDLFLRAAPAFQDPTLRASLSHARIYYQEIQQLRLCWVLPDS